MTAVLMPDLEKAMPPYLPPVISQLILQYVANPVFNQVLQDVRNAGVGVRPRECPGWVGQLNSGAYMEDPLFPGVRIHRPIRPSAMLGWWSQYLERFSHLRPLVVPRPLVAYIVPVMHPLMVLDRMKHKIYIAQLRYEGRSSEDMLEREYLSYYMP